MHTHPCNLTGHHSHHPQTPDAKCFDSCEQLIRSLSRLFSCTIIHPVTFHIDGVPRPKQVAPKWDVTLFAALQLFFRGFNLAYERMAKSTVSVSSRLGNTFTDLECFPAVIPDPEPAFSVRISNLSEFTVQTGTKCQYAPCSSPICLDA